MPGKLAITRGYSEGVPGNGGLTLIGAPRPSRVG